MFERQELIILLDSLYMDKIDLELYLGREGRAKKEELEKLEMMEKILKKIEKQLN